MIGRVLGLFLIAALLANPALSQVSVNMSGQGGIRLGDNTHDCNASRIGSLRFSSLRGDIYFCNGNAWLTVGVPGINDLTDAIANYTTYNIFLGSSSGTATTTGTHNIGIGFQTLSTNVAGQYNIALGLDALRYAFNTGTLSGRRNIAIGYEALRGDSTASNNSGTDNVAIGYQAMLNNRSGSHNIAIGLDVFKNNQSSSYNIMIGRNAGQNPNFSGARNIGIGAFSFISGPTSASDNIGIGQNAGDGWSTVSNSIAITGGPIYNLTGNNNVIIGNRAGSDLTSGANNVLIGERAGWSGTNLTTASNNTIIGARAGANANNYTNGTALGALSELTGSNRIVLGYWGTSGIYAQVTSITAISDARRKKDVAEINLGLDFIKKLRPVSYRFNNGDETLRYGVIAQELLAALPPDMIEKVESAQGDINPYALIQRDTDKQRSYRVNYGELTAPLTKAIQEQQAMLDAQQMRIDALNAALDAR